MNTIQVMTMHVILDANIFIKDFSLQSAGFQVLISQIPVLDITIVIPEVVIQEATFHFQQKIADEVDKARKQLERLERLTHSKLSLMFEQSEQYASSYHERLKNFILDVDGDIVPYPDTPHATLAQLAVEKRKPFSNRGGYRDALIWYTVLDIASRAESVVLVTENTKDFCEEDGSIHSDLIQQAKERGVDPDRLQIVTSLDEFIIKYVKPSLADGRINDTTIEHIRDYILNEVNMISYDIWDHRTGTPKLELWKLDIPLEDGEFTLEGISSIESVDVREVRILKDGNLLVLADARVEANLSFFLSKSDYYALYIESEISIAVADWNRHYMLGEATRLIDLELNFLLTERGEDIISFDLISIEGASKE